MAFRFGPKAAAAPTPNAALNPAAIENDKSKKKQQMVLAMAGGAALLVGGLWIMTRDEKDEKVAVATDGTEVRIKVDDLRSRNLNEGEWISRSENELAELKKQMSNLEKTADPTDLRKRMEKLEAENRDLKTDGQRLFTAMSAENEKLKRRMQSAPAAQSREATAAQQEAGSARGAGRWRGEEPFRVAGGGAGGERGTGASQQAAGLSGIAQVKTINFSPVADGKGGATPVGFQSSAPTATPTIIEASADYLPPNSYAPARVVVGVDASAGVVSQTDPLPVLLRITGAARSVVNNGKVLTTSLEGCVVSGAARGDLSAEKVYVKLVKMTCDQPNGRVAVSDVKGYISFAGKAGVRGRVVSREGDFVTKAAIAGVIGGFGRGLTANANAVFAGGTTVVDGERQKLTPQEIAVAGLGQGFGDTADMVSKYLIERAEQYQPVIEMPTGIDVDIVFLEGVYVRGGGS